MVTRRRSSLAFAGVALLLAALSVVPRGRPASTAPVSVVGLEAPSQPGQQRPGAGVAGIPGDPSWHFVENRGQWPAGLFYAQAGNQEAWIGEGGFWLVGGGWGAGAPRTALRFTFEGAQAGPTVAGETPLPGYHNYFFGSRPEGWRTHVQLFARVVASEVWPVRGIS